MSRRGRGFHYPEQSVGQWDYMLNCIGETAYNTIDLGNPDHSSINDRASQIAVSVGNDTLGFWSMRHMNTSQYFAIPVNLHEWCTMYGGFSMEMWYQSFKDSVDIGTALFDNCNSTYNGPSIVNLNSSYYAFNGGGLISNTVAGNDRIWNMPIGAFLRGTLKRLRWHVDYINKSIYCEIVDMFPESETGSGTLVTGSSTFTMVRDQVRNFSLSIPASTLSSDNKVFLLKFTQTRTGSPVGWYNGFITIVLNNISYNSHTYNIPLTHGMITTDRFMTALPDDQILGMPMDLRDLTLPTSGNVSLNFSMRTYPNTTWSSSTPGTASVTFSPVLYSIPITNTKLFSQTSDDVIKLVGSDIWRQCNKLYIGNTSSENKGMQGVIHQVKLSRGFNCPFSY